MDTIKLEILYKEHKHLIGKIINRNWPLLAALKLEREDVSQELSIAMIEAIQRFDPERSESLERYLWYSLQYEVLNMKQIGRASCRERV